MHGGLKTVCGIGTCSGAEALPGKTSLVYSEGLVHKVEG